jgi:AhpD family alkylhydroperoxidase
MQTISFESASQTRGGLSDMIKTLAQSPSALDGYLEFRDALSGSALSPALCEQIALVVAQTNLCESSLAEHSHLAVLVGVTKEEILDSREARSPDAKTEAVLRFARDVTARKRQWPLNELRENGCSDADIVEIIAHVALNNFENYLNRFARAGRGGERWLTAAG